MKTGLRLMAVLTGIILLSALAWSQATSSGSISGQVTDQSGGAIPGADLTLVDNGTQTTLRAQTNAAGRYVFINVPSGKYSLRTARDGFTQAQTSGIDVTVGASLTINVQLKIGKTTETVTVEAQTIIELQTTNATVGNTIDSKSIQFLPNLGRDVSTLAVLQPAVTSSGFTAGAYNDQNTYTLDGGTNTDDMAGNTIGYLTNYTGTGGGQSSNYASGVVPTPIESIEEMKVSVAGQGIDFNSAVGANVQMVTKRGTNQFHGSLYEFYFSTTTGAANTWSNDHTPSAAFGTPYTPIVPNHRNRYGFALGGPMLPKMAGGKTYFFFNYERLNFPNGSFYEAVVPTLALRAGVVQVPNAAGVYTAYNLNPTAVNVGSTAGQPGASAAGGAAVTGSVAPALCGGVSCDPRGIGLNPIVNQIWQKYMPLPNDFSGAVGDIYNTAGYISSIKQPQLSTFYVGRVDHDFGDKNRLFASYRYFSLTSLTSNQVDIGGYFPGDTLGTPVASAPRPQKPSFMVLGLTSNLTPSLTNDLRVNYTRNWWQWSVDEPLGGQLPGMGGMLEIGGESANALIPFNVNTQSTRQRFWDGQDKLIRDDLSLIKGNHLFQFGGLYQRNNDYHSRTDNGAGQNNQVIYQSNLLSLNYAGYFPSAVPSGQQSNYGGLASEVLGIVSQSQIVYARSGANLSLLPIGSAATDRSIIPYYNMYWGDTWHVKPGLTVVYGLAYAIELPPYELNGKQIVAVDPSGNPISAANYLATKQRMALAGQNYNPQIGFSLVGNVGSGLKYPYATTWGEFSPRFAVAWNPSYNDGLMGKLFGQGKTVVRGSYSRIYGRLNGVDQVLVPLLGPGFLQASSCPNTLSNGTCGSIASTPANAFRIGTDGLSAPLVTPPGTLPQPYFPGVNGAANGGDINTIDPNFKPNHTDNFTFSIQRQINKNMTIDVGYIGRITRNDFQEIDLDAVPTMYTLGGQSFAQAYASSYLAACGLTTACNGGVAPNVAAIPVQPFFEAALGGASSTFCKTASSCTAAVFANATALSALKTTSVSTLWNTLTNFSTWVPGKTTISQLGQANSIALSTSLGFSNYNALYVSYRVKDYHGLTLQSNFTWSKALGTGELGQYNSSNTALNPFDMQANYGTQLFDYKYVANIIMYYQPPWFKSQKGIAGHLLGGWTISPLLQAQSGAPIRVGFAETGCTSCQGFGEVGSSASALTSAENAVLTSPYTGNITRNLNNAGNTGVAGLGNVGTVNPTGQNAYTNPGAILSEFRPCILGYDTSCGGYDTLHGLPVWNVDATIAKNFSILKDNRLGGSLVFQITNIFNHLNPSNPTMTITSPTTFGRITSTQFSVPRAMEFGLRFAF